MPCVYIDAKYSMFVTDRKNETASTRGKTLVPFIIVASDFIDLMMCPIIYFIALQFRK